MESNGRGERRAKGLQGGLLHSRYAPLIPGRSSKWVRTVSRMLALILLASSARGQAIDEDQFKAAFLFNVASFVEWPEGSFKNASDPIVSCIVGEDGLNEALEQAVNGKVAGRRGYVVRRIPANGQFEGCHILFVAQSQARRLRSALTNNKSTGLLTVGESEDFAQNGGIIALKRIGDHMRIQINLEAADRNGLRLSSRLLALSQVVKAGIR